MSKVRERRVNKTEGSTLELLKTAILYFVYALRLSCPTDRVGGSFINKIERARIVKYKQVSFH